MIKPLATLLLSVALTTTALADNDCKTLIMATENNQVSLNTYQIEVKLNGLTVLNEKRNTIQTDSLKCGKNYTAYIRKLNNGKVEKTRTRTFTVIKSNRIIVNMGG